MPLNGIDWESRTGKAMENITLDDKLTVIISVLDTIGSNNTREHEQINLRLDVTNGKVKCVPGLKWQLKGAFVAIGTAFTGLSALFYLLWNYITK